MAPIKSIFLITEAFIMQYCKLIILPTNSPRLLVLNNMKWFIFSQRYGKKLSLMSA